MPKLKNQRHIADIWCQQTIDSVPKAREQAQKFYNIRESFGTQWPAWCGLPIAATIAILTNGAPTSLVPFIMMSPTKRMLIANLAAALIWIQSKAIYNFDETLAEVLVSEPVDYNLPIESLLCMPHHCCFIEYPFQVDNNVYCGAFVWLECDPHTLIPELRILYLKPDGSTLPIALILQGGTIFESLSAWRASSEDRGGLTHDEMLERWPDEVLHTLTVQVSAVVNMVLYLVSENRDMLDEPIKRSTDNYGNPKHARTWHVGVRIGRSIRSYRRAVQESEQQHRTGESFSPRPHMRRAHYHHFWTGPRDGERKLVVRWLSPIPVNWKDDTELPAVIHLVTPNKDV